MAEDEIYCAPQALLRIDRLTFARTIRRVCRVVRALCLRSAQVVRGFPRVNSFGAAESAFDRRFLPPFSLSCGGIRSGATKCRRNRPSRHDFREIRG